jgi:hypothetical protein
MARSAKIALVAHPAWQRNQASRVGKCAELLHTAPFTWVSTISAAPVLPGRLMHGATVKCNGFGSCFPGKPWCVRRTIRRSRPETQQPRRSRKPNPRMPTGIAPIVSVHRIAIALVPYHLAGFPLATHAEHLHCALGLQIACSACTACRPLECRREAVTASGCGVLPVVIARTKAWTGYQLTHRSF